jgi:subtilisin family serine protease
MKIFIILFILLCTIHSTILPSVTTALSQNPHVNIIILFKDQVNLKALPKIDIESRAQLIVHSLQQMAQKTQYRIIKFLKSRSIEYISFWSTNCIAVYHANSWLIEKLDEFSEVDVIGLNEPIKALHDLPDSVSAPVQETKNQTIEWGIKWIKAPEVWEKGVYGQNIIVGSIDTGVQWDHASLKRSYRGVNEDGQVNHNYAWFDGLRKCVDCKYPNICGCKSNNRFNSSQ